MRSAITGRRESGAVLALLESFQNEFEDLRSQQGYDRDHDEVGSMSARLSRAALIDWAAAEAPMRNEQVSVCGSALA